MSEKIKEDKIEGRSDNFISGREYSKMVYNYEIKIEELEECLKESTKGHSKKTLCKMKSDASKMARATIISMIKNGSEFGLIFLFLAAYNGRIPEMFVIVDSIEKMVVIFSIIFTGFTFVFAFMKIIWLTIRAASELDDVDYSELDE